MRQGLGPSLYLAPHLGWMPRYGADLASAPALVELAEQGIRGGRAKLALRQAIQADLAANGGSQTPQGRVLIQTVQSHAAEVQSAQRALEAAWRGRFAAR